ncbi:MAG: glycosyltransferase [Ignavibacteria bacterium]
MALRLLKFDTINPEQYLNERVKENLPSIKSMSRKEFLEWIISLRGNFSDFYTHNLQKLGWEAEEFFVTSYYIDKVADELYGKSKKIKKIKNKLKDKVRPVRKRWILNVIAGYIEKYKPDVILVREVIGLPSDFWKGYSNKILLVSRIAAPIPRLWSPADWDLILTSTTAYKTFFELNGIDSFINHNGFDERILKEVKNGTKKHELTFVGGLGDRYWAERTKCVEYFAGKVDFKWWGYNGNKYPEDHPINKSWQGLTSGLEMLQIYSQSKIVFNDYGKVADGMAVNQRMFEVLGLGSFLLTRDAENLNKEYPKNIFITYKDNKDCLDKINYYLKNEKEREEIAEAGQKYLLNNFTYVKLMNELDTVLRKSFQKKFLNKSNNL